MNLISDLYNECMELDADSIRSLIVSEKYSEKEYSVQNGVSYKICDVASLFTAVSYLADPECSDKEELRKQAYTAFFSEDRTKFSSSWGMIDLLTGKSSSCADDISVRILKGGSYKIKNYYLENYQLSDIRGASVLLTYVEEELIPSVISEKYIPECIIYCGGGNIFAVVPESCTDDFAVSLEKKAKDLLVSADIAYYISNPENLSVIFGEGYNRKMVDIENALGERKKLIINTGGSADFVSEAGTLVIPSSTPDTDDGFTVTFSGSPVHSKKICQSCGKRVASYKSADDYLCLSCMHKHCVGLAAKKNRYVRQYNDYNSSRGIKADSRINSMADIAGTSKYIAVVYGDGNNMGGIIQKFTRINQMMEFSRDVKKIAARSVFESMGEHEITEFEVVGLGGDDIFVIVRGDKAVRFAVSLIRKYNSRFEKYRSLGQVSTLSAGIAVAKHDMPVQIILEEAEKQLSEAKSEVKKFADNNGSLSYRILDTFEGESDCSNLSGIRNTLLPYLTDAAENIIDFTLKLTSEIGKSGLRNILEAYEKAESEDEANLFFEYYKVRNKKIELPAVDGYTVSGGYYVREDTKEKCYIWNDILNLMDYLA